ncbi:MAG: DUF3987 domain-containing protein, partial [Alcaligenaceae bacterium]
MEALPYPLEALPKLLRSVCDEVSAFVQAPEPMMVMSCLAAISVAAQPFYDVERANGLHGPISMYFLAIADSGERKSTIDRLVMSWLRDWEADQIEQAQPMVKQYATDMEIWEAKRAGLKEQIKTLAKASKGTVQQERELRDMDLDEPKPPRIPRMFFGDVTSEALLYEMSRWPSGAVISDEAGNVFGGHAMGKDAAMRNLACLNKFWDGGTQQVDRRSTKSFSVKSARLTNFLQVQESMLRAFFENSKGLARGSGFLARFMMAWPASTQGKRMFREPPSEWPALALFNARLKTIIDRPMPMDENGILSPSMLTLSPDAKLAWVGYFNEIESMLASGGELFDVRDVASKIADNAVRLAALLHVFEGHVGPIGVDSMESGARIATWHLNEARRFLGEAGQSAAVADPARLER